MADEKDRRLIIEDANIFYLNFAGKEGKFNEAGDRNFCVELDPETADRLTEDGWSVRTREGREEGDPDMAYLPVKVSFKNRPPRIVLVTSGPQTPLTEDMVEIVDHADIKTVDLIVRPYDWEVNGKTGTKAYLQTMFVTIHEDELERKYGYYDAPAEAIQPGDDANE